MQRLGRLIWVVGGIMLCAAACTTPPTPVLISEADATRMAAGPPTEAPVPPETPVVLSLQVNTFDGFTTTPTNPGTEMIQALRYETLLTYNEDNQLVPLLASAMPQVSADGLEWRVAISEHVTFHNGVPLTAEFFTANLQDQLARVRGSTLGEVMLPSLVQQIDADGDEVVFTLREPFSEFPALLAEAGWVIRHSDGSGTGPFVLAGENEGMLQFSAFANYHGGVPYMAQIHVGVMPPDAGDGVLSVVQDGEQPMTLWENQGPERWILFDTRLFPLNDSQVIQALTTNDTARHEVLAAVGLPDGFDMPVWVTSGGIDGRLREELDALQPVIALPEIRTLPDVISAYPPLVDGVPRAIVMTLYHELESAWWQQFMALDGAEISLAQIGFEIELPLVTVSVSEQISGLAETSSGWPRITAQTRLADQESTR